MASGNALKTCESNGLAISSSLHWSVANVFARSALIFFQASPSIFLAVASLPACNALTPFPHSLEFLYANKSAGLAAGMKEHSRWSVARVIIQGRSPAGGLAQVVAELTVIANATAMVVKSRTAEIIT